MMRFSKINYYDHRRKNSFNRSLTHASFHPFFFPFWFFFLFSYTDTLASLAGTAAGLVGLRSDLSVEVVVVVEGGGGGREECEILKGSCETISTNSGAAGTTSISSFAMDVNGEGGDKH